MITIGIFSERGIIGLMLQALAAEGVLPLIAD